MFGHMKLAFAAGAVLAGGVSAAGAQPLSGDALRNLVADKQVYLATPYGIEFPLTYNSNGTVTGDGRGTGLGQFFAPKETGEWWVEGQSLCQKFPTWYDGKTSCFTIRRTGEASLSWTRDDGETGTARIEG